MLKLTDKEKGLIRECLIVVAKMQGVDVNQMKELLVLSEKFELKEPDDTK